MYPAHMLELSWCRDIDKKLWKKIYRMFSCCLDIPASDFLCEAMEFMLGAPVVAASDSGIPTRFHCLDHWSYFRMIL